MSPKLISKCHEGWFVTTKFCFGMTSPDLNYNIIFWCYQVEWDVFTNVSQFFIKWRYLNWPYHATWLPRYLRSLLSHSLGWYPSTVTVYIARNIYCRIFYVDIRCLHILHFLIGNSEQNSSLSNGSFWRNHIHTPHKKESQRHSPGQNHSILSRGRPQILVWDQGNPPLKCHAQNSSALHMIHGEVSGPSQHFPRRCGRLGRVLVPVRGSRLRRQHSSGSNFHFSGEKTHVTSWKKTCMCFFLNQRKTSEVNIYDEPIVPLGPWLSDIFWIKVAIFLLKPRLGFHHLEF